MKQIETPRLRLLVQSLEETRKRIDTMPDEDKADLSPHWLSLLAAATHPDPWILGFNILRRDDKVIIGNIGFKGPPSTDGMVEIAYCVEDTWQGNGYATEAAEAVTLKALQQDSVRFVRAHTLPEPNASTRVLTKAGFRNVGQVIDPEDGPVWRWERHPDAT